MMDMDQKQIKDLLAQAREEKKEDKARLRALYLEQIEDYCNLSFEKDLPAGVVLALDELVKTDPSRFNLASEKLSDMAVTYSGTSDGLPGYIRNWLNPYRRIYLAGNKRKRPYIANPRH
ncbi:conserved domain protein [Peptoniphilus sp. oral taxon 375 str. F0436]|nr:conserved domain protein [Peptoniphilus sp. oral taxon 375 str. F0436]